MNSQAPVGLLLAFAHYLSLCGDSSAVSWTQITSGVKTSFKTTNYLIWNVLEFLKFAHGGRFFHPSWKRGWLDVNGVNKLNQVYSP